MFNRRQFLGAGLAASAAYATGAMVPVWAQNAPNLGTPTLPAPGLSPHQAGRCRGGVADRRHCPAARWAKNSSRTRRWPRCARSLASQGLATDYIDIPFTPFLIVAGGRRILMDTGLGDWGGPTTGKLLAHLRDAGLQAADIDTVLITHYHGDHINGLRNKAGEFMFPKAKVMVPAPEHAFWMDDAKMAAAPAGMKGAFDNARRTFAQMPAGMLQTFEPGTELAPGLRSVAAYGHTPGHTLFEFSSGGQTFAYIGDLTNVPALFARNPDWAVTFDMDAEAARQVRRATFGRLVSANAMVGGFHFPFPAFGRMAAQGNGYALPAAGLTWAGPPAPQHRCWHWPSRWTGRRSSRPSRGHWTGWPSAGRPSSRSPAPKPPWPSFAASCRPPACAPRPNGAVAATSTPAAGASARVGPGSSPMGGQRPTTSRPCT